MFSASRTFSDVVFRDEAVTRVSVKLPPAFKVSTTCDSGPGDDNDGEWTGRSDAYYAMRAILLTVSKIRRERRLDVVVVPCLKGANTSAFRTAHDMCAATQDFFKLQ